MAVDADTDNGQKVTNAILGQKIDNLCSKVNDLADNMKIHCNQSYVRDNRISVLETQVGSNIDEIKTLRSKSDIWSSLNSIGAIVAGILGVNK
jgi:hypothetical protein